MKPLPILFAQESAPSSPPAGDGKAAAPPMQSNFLWMMMVVFALFYLIVLLPANRRQKREQAEMVASIKQGAKVVTTSGIVGTITSIKDGDDEVILRSEDTKIRVLRSTIQKVLNKAEGETKA
ncbi:MAG: preprotein translocase subunit YajC [Gemmataceae bacterium]